MKRYRFVRHPEVANDLLDIAHLIASYAGTQIALRKLDEIETAIRKLAEAPHKGSIRDAVAPGLRAIPAAGKGVICFVVDDETREVRIMAIGYAGSDWIGVTRGRT